MTPQQLQILVKTLTAHHSYTLTGADDWPILGYFLGGFALLLVYIWQDLKREIKSHRAEWQAELKDEIEERKSQDSYLRESLREHKEDCLNERERANGKL